MAKRTVWSDGSIGWNSQPGMKSNGRKEGNQPGNGAGRSRDRAGKGVKDLSLAAAEAKCQRLLACRERSSGELRQRLGRDGFDGKTINGLVDRLVAAGLVDDERFCRLFIAGKRRLGWGMQRIGLALRALYIDIADYPELASEFTEDSDELSRARECLESYRGRAKDGYAGRYRYLAAKGYSGAIIRQAMVEWSTDRR